MSSKTLISIPPVVIVFKLLFQNLDKLFDLGPFCGAQIVFLFFSICRGTDWENRRNLI